MAERREDFLASRFSFLVVQISEADYHRSENKRGVWWDYRLFPPISRLYSETNRALVQAGPDPVVVALFLRISISIFLRILERRNQ